MARAGYSLFLPSTQVYADDQPAHFLEVELRYDL